MNFELLLFDLDNTLLRTDDLEMRFRGHNHLGPQTKAYTDALVAAAIGQNRLIYTEDFLTQLRQSYPELKIAVFTRSPKSYTNTLLSLFYPNFFWDAVIAYEDVGQTKPAPNGIFDAASRVGVKLATAIALIGDAKSDVQAAYRAGIWMVADTSSWPWPNINENYHVRERVPDAIIAGPHELISFLEKPAAHLPLLEMWERLKQPRPHEITRPIDHINHFDRTNDNRRHVRIAALGRRFRDDELDATRRSWHPISKEIEALKDAEVFPDHWIGALREFISTQPSVVMGYPTTVTVIPAKPGRFPRLEHLLAQLARSNAESAIRPYAPIAFNQDILRYTEGVRSNHGEYLNAVERFENIRDHLVVADPASAAARNIIVIDDVVTSGATLFYAYHYLRDAGAISVVPISLTKAVSGQ